MQTWMLAIGFNRKRKNEFTASGSAVKVNFSSKNPSLPPAYLSWWRLTFTNRGYPKTNRTFWILSFCWPLSMALRPQHLTTTKVANPGHLQMEANQILCLFVFFGSTTPLPCPATVFLMCFSVFCWFGYISKKQRECRICIVVCCQPSLGSCSRELVQPFRGPKGTSLELSH